MIFCRSAQTFCESLSAVCLFKTISQLRDVLGRQAAFFLSFSILRRINPNCQILRKIDFEFTMSHPDSVHIGSERTVAYNGDTLSPKDVKAIQELFTSSLDNKSKVLVKDILLKLKQEDTSMIGIFHDLEFMDGLCGIALNKKSLQYLGVKYCKDFLLFLFCGSSAALHAFQDKVMYLFRTNVQNNAEFLIHAVFRRMHGCHICGG